jgi:hypothetical protein
MSDAKTNIHIPEYKRESDPRIILDSKETRVSLKKKENGFMPSVNFHEKSPELKEQEL